MSPSGLMTFLDCPRKWWYEKVAKLRSPSTASQALGTRMHAVVEVFLGDGDWPALGATIDLGRRDGEWNVTQDVLDIAVVNEPRLRSLRAAPGPVGIETVIKRPAGDPVFGELPVYMVCDWWDATPRVADHKSTKDLTADYHLTAEGLARHPQMLMYAAGLFWPSAPPVVALEHLYYQTQGARAGRVLQTEASWQAIVDAMGRVREVSVGMKATASIAIAAEVPYKRSACGKYGGCAHIAYCAVHSNPNPFANTHSTGPTMDMSALLAGGTPAPTPEPAAPAADAPSPFVPPDDAGPAPTAPPVAETAPSAAEATAAASAPDETPDASQDPFFDWIVGILQERGGRASIDDKEIKAAIKSAEGVKALNAKRKIAYLGKGADAGHWDFSASEIWLAADEPAETPAEDPAPPEAPSNNIAPGTEAPIVFLAPTHAVTIYVGCRDIDNTATHLDDVLRDVYAAVQTQHSVPDWSTVAYGAGKGLVYAAATQPDADGASVCGQFVGELYVRPNHPLVGYLRLMWPDAKFIVANGAEV